MKKKNLKKLILLLSLIAVLGCLIAAYAVQKNINEKAALEEAEEDGKTEVFTVFDKGSTIITALSFTYEEESLSFSYVNDDWVYDKDRSYPLDQDGVASMAQAVAKVDAVLKVEPLSDDMADYGLDTPVLTVDAQFSDDSKKTFTFGDVNSFNDCRYFTVSGDDSVYMVSSELSEPFAADLDSLYKAESYPLLKDSVTSSDVTSITLDVSGKTKEITDDKGIEKLFELIYTLDLSSWEDYYADSEEMASVYGISTEGDKITVNYTYESTGTDGTKTKLPKTYVVYIGADYEAADAEDIADAEGGEDSDKTEEKKEKYYFYSFDSSTVVYGADGETVDEIFTYLAHEAAEDTAAANE